MQDESKIPLDEPDDGAVPCPAMPTNEGKKAILVGKKYHGMLRYLCSASVPRSTLVAQVEALIEVAYYVQRGKEKKNKEKKNRAARQRSAWV